MELYEFSTKANECNLVPLRNILMEKRRPQKRRNRDNKNERTTQQTKHKKKK